MSSHNFNMETHAIFPGYGYLEHHVHNALQPMQVQDVAGTEWFTCTPAHAIQTITSLIEADKAAHTIFGHQTDNVSA